MQEESGKGGFKREGPVVQSVGRLRLAPSYPPEPLDKQHPETRGMHSESQERLLVKIWLLPPHSAPVHTLAMIDSGADGNFLDRSFALRNKLPLTKKQSPMSVVGIDGRPLVSGDITEESQLELICKASDSNYHAEGKTSFSAISSPNHDVILGLPWLRLHHPNINWKTTTLSFNSEHCSHNCEFRNHPPSSQCQSAQVSKSAKPNFDMPSAKSTFETKYALPTSETKSATICKSENPLAQNQVTQISNSRQDSEFANTLKSDRQFPWINTNKDSPLQPGDLFILSHLDNNM